MKKKETKITLTEDMINNPEYYEVVVEVSYGCGGDDFTPFEEVGTITTDLAEVDEVCNNLEDEGYIIDYIEYTVRDIRIFNEYQSIIVDFIDYYEAELYEATLQKLWYYKDDTNTSINIEA